MTDVTHITTYSCVAVSETYFYVSSFSYQSDVYFPTMLHILLLTKY